MVKVRQRSDTNTWQVDFTAALGGVGPPKRWRLQAPRHVTSKSGAERWARQQLTRVLRGEEPHSTKEGRAQRAEQKAERAEQAAAQQHAAMTVAQWAEQWQANERARRVRETTLETRAKALRRLCRVIGDKPLAQVSDLDMEAVVRELADLHSSTATNYLVTIRACLNAAHRLGLRAQPVATQRVRRTEPPTERPHLLPEESARLVAASRGLSLRHRAVVLLGLDAGLRAGEMAGLRAEDIDGDDLHVRRSAATIGRARVIHPTKSNKPRTIPLTPRLAEVLDQLAEQTKDGWLIHDSRGAPAVRHHVEALLAVALKRAGLPEHYPHVLRHTFATDTLAASGGDLEALRRLLGHSNIAVTARYCHAPDTARREAISRLAEARERASALGTATSQSEAPKKARR